MANFSVKATVHFEADDDETKSKISSKAEHLGKYWGCWVITKDGRTVFEHSAEQIGDAYLWAGCAAKDLERYIKRFKKARVIP